MIEQDGTIGALWRLFDPFWGSFGYVGISFSAQYEAEVLADVPAAEVAVLEDERMAGNMQAGIPHGCYGKHWIKDRGSWAVLTGQLSNWS